MVFFIDKARSSPPPRLLTNVNKKMFFFNEGFPYCTLSQFLEFPKLVLQLFTKMVRSEIILGESVSVRRPGPGEGDRYRTSQD